MYFLMYVEAVLGAPSEPYANDITNDVNALAVYNAVRGTCRGIFP